MSPASLLQRQPDRCIIRGGGVRRNTRAAAAGSDRADVTARNDTGEVVQLSADPKGRHMPGKRVQFDDETWRALDLLARDSMKDFQELADEAFTDLLKKHQRPLTLKDALRRSARRAPANDPSPRDGSRPAGAKTSRRKNRT